MSCSPFSILMRTPRRLLLAAFAAGALLSSAAAAERVTLNFNPDWRFIKDDPAGAQAPGFDDKGWAAVAAPHTYNDVDTFDNWSTPGHRGEQIQWGGRTWYRKTFNVPADWRGKKVFIEFEAVRQIAEVYLNGQLLGVAKSGFTPFGFDLTPHLKLDGPNVLAVMADNRFMKDPLDAKTAAEIAQRNGLENKSGLSSTENPNLSALSRKVNETIPDKIEDLQADQIPWNNPHWHPAHGGIYRNVRLYVTDPLHISLPLYSFLQTAGPYVYATEVSDAAANVTLEVPAQNERTTAAAAELSANIIDGDGKVVLTLTSSQSIAAGASATFKVSGQVAQPRLWQPDYPHVYRVVCSLRVGGETVDTAEIPLGIRTVRWDASSGFFINGRHVKLHGWGQKPTDEWPGLGAALPDWLHFYTLFMMQQAGGNFVRWGHSASGPAQINSGDRLGIIALQPGVDGESDTVKAAWKLRAMTFRDMVIYFRNNPSILIWEGGNQKVTQEHGKELHGYVDQYDPHGGRAYAHRRADKTTAEFMDIGVGTEGGREIASLPVVEGEYDREESPRRVWDNASPPNLGYPEAKGMTYQLTSEEYAVNQVNQYVKKLGPAWHAGGANWIFSDSTSGGRVPAEVARTSGEVDGVRLPKEAYYVCAVMFRATPQVHIIGHWTYPANTKKNVYVASNAEDVELFVNGRSLGHAQPVDNYLFTFKDVAFEPGEIKAVATTGGKVTATQAKHTVGAPVALRLHPLFNVGGLRADGSDVALVDVEALDAKGDRCPTFEQRVDFELDGPAIWRGGYNSGKINSINNTYLNLECGINRVAVRATRTAGKITITAKADGLKSGSVTIESQPFEAENGMSTTLPAIPPVRVAPTSPPHPELTTPAAPLAQTPKAAGPATPGKFIKNMNYTGPQAAIVHVEINASNGRNIYVDRDYTWTNLPDSLVGADWLQVADADARYSAVDLIELAVPANTVVTIAHDNRVTVPEWLTKQFKATGQTIAIHGKPMALFEHRAEKDESLTFGSNTDDSRPPASNMYVVLVNAAK
jgi:beta-galactosidase